MNIKERNAQSILELAIFGSIMLGILGIIISYGLNFNYQQKASMQANRKALFEAEQLLPSGEKKGEASYIIVSDKHIPNPSDVFGVGGAVPVMASGQAIKSVNMQLVASNKEELPEMIINIDGVEYPYKTAGFYLPPDDPPLRYYPPGIASFGAPDPLEEQNELRIKKYEEVYGYNNVCSDLDCGAIQGDCVQWETPPDEVDPVYGEAEGSGACVAYELTLKVIDTNQGEIMDYDAMTRRCNLIANFNANPSSGHTPCETFCIKGGTSEEECVDICSQDIAIPWYCQGPEGGPYVPKDGLFAFSGIEKYKVMGIAPETAQVALMNNQIHKQEKISSITVTDTRDWEIDTTRTVYYHEMDGNGYAYQNDDYTSNEFTTNVSQDETNEWYVEIGKGESSEGK